MQCCAVPPGCSGQSIGMRTLPAATLSCDAPMRQHTHTRGEGGREMRSEQPPAAWGERHVLQTKSPHTRSSLPHAAELQHTADCIALQHCTTLHRLKQTARGETRRIVKTWKHGDLEDRTIPHISRCSDERAPSAANTKASNIRDDTPLRNRTVHLPVLHTCLSARHVYIYIYIYINMYTCLEAQHV